MTQILQTPPFPGKRNNNEMAPNMEQIARICFPAARRAIAASMYKMKPWTKNPFK